MLLGYFYRALSQAQFVNLPLTGPYISYTVVAVSTVKDSHAMLDATVHPLSGQMLSGAEIVVQVLADEGVDTIFGYSGGAILPTYDAIFVYNQDNQRHGQRMPLIVPANEQGAGVYGSGLCARQR